MQNVQCWLQPCMMLTNAVTGRLARSVPRAGRRQCSSDCRLAPGFTLNVHDFLPFARQNVIQIFSGAMEFLRAEHQIHVGQLLHAVAGRGFAPCTPRIPARRRAARDGLRPRWIRILPIAFCSAISRTLHVLSRIDIRGRLPRRERVTLGDDLGGDGFRVALIHLATVSFDVNTRHDQLL